MHIGFDAKRYFLNYTGLGSYCRNVINGLATLYNENTYTLYSTKYNPHFDTQSLNTVLPQNRFVSSSLWRSWLITHTLQKSNLQVYHGLSNELPFNIQQLIHTKKIVTIHDTIFLRYPQWYNRIDVATYTIKWQNACKKANHIVAVSTQTKNDLIHFFNTPAHKISVIPPAYDPIFENPDYTSPAALTQAKQLYKLQKPYIIYVGAIAPRKNLITAVKALNHLIKEKKQPANFYIIGNGAQKPEIEAYIQKNNLQLYCKIISNVPTTHLPALYAQATALLYPSIFEGFGIPIIEAQISGTPAVTSQGSCFEETGGKHTLYAPHHDHEYIAEQLYKLLTNNTLQNTIIQQGLVHAQQFSQKNTTQALHQLYTS